MQFFKNGGEMVRVIEEIVKEQDFVSFVNIVVGAYPGRMDGAQPTKEQLKNLFMYNQSNDESLHYYGL